MVESGGLGYVAPGLADDGGEFTFVVQLLRKTRAHDGRQVANETRVEPDEDGRIVRWFESALQRVIGIIESDADRLFCILQRRQELNFLRIDCGAAGKSISRALQRCTPG